MNGFLTPYLKIKGDFMLGNWRSHADYQAFVKSELAGISSRAPFSVAEYATEISKLYILNLDPLKAIIAPLYSVTGRPSELQSEIFRACVLLGGMGLPPDKWLPKLNANPVLRATCGFGDKLPGIASFYDFMHRIVKLDDKPRFKRHKRKPRKKVGKGKKLPHKRKLHFLFAFRVWQSNLHQPRLGFAAVH